MTGTGTQTDPYIVTNADELIEATSASEGGDTRYVKLGADINMDGHVNVDMYFYELDGDGHSIININVENANGLIIHALGVDTTIKNISFTSCSALLSGALIKFEKNPEARTNVSIHDCNCSVKCTSYGGGSSGVLLNVPGGTSSYPVIIDIERCVVDITHTSNNSMYNLMLHDANYSTININWSHINVDITFAVASGNARAFDVWSYNNCYFTGKVISNAPSGMRSGAVFYAYKQINNSYAAVQGTNVNAPLLVCGTAAGVNFYDSDIYDGTTDSKFLHLTTAQCKDINYLNSIGFDVVPGGVI